MTLLSSLRMRPMSRDKANTLLLIAACSVALLPHVVRVPAWVAATCVLLMCWRAWITLRGNRLPPRWLLLPAAAVLMAASYMHFGTWFGRDAGVAMLLILMALKLLEMHARSDFWVSIFLSYFLILAQYFFSQTIATATMTAFAVVLLLTTQLSFQYTGIVPPFRKRLRAAAVCCLLALPIAAVLFVLFPRLQGPLWGLPKDAHSGRTGLSDTMTPGNISRLAESDEIAFRVKFAGKPPPKAVLYWRGIVLGDYDGRTWAPFRLRRSSEAFNIKLLSGPIGYQVTLEPSGHRWLFALDLPVAAPDVDGKPSSFTPELELRSPQPVNSRTRYDASSALSYRLDAGDTPSDLGNWLSLPSGTNPGTNEFARHLRARHTEPEKAIDAVLHYFRNEPFRYTLEPPLLGVHSVDDFLFNTRAGFCEHYSGAFVVIMRAMGIPARVVTGYLGGELNAIDGFMEVRQSDAHAWAEVWLPQQGWLRVDPTAAVAPERIERNLYSAVPRRYLGGLVTTTGDNATLAWLLKVRSGWNAVGNAWNQWVLNYSSDKQKNLVRSLGLDASNWRDLILLLVACMALITVAIAYGLVRAREKVDPVVALYAKLCRRMEKHGLMRNRFEGPLSYRERLSRANALSGSQKEAAIRFLELYQAVQYGVSEPSRAAAAVRLKKLLSECR